MLLGYPHKQCKSLSVNCSWGFVQYALFYKPQIFLRGTNIVGQDA